MDAPSDDADDEDVTTALARSARHPGIDAWVARWLEEAEGRSGSERTERAYRETLASFRAALWNRGTDLHAPRSVIREALATWASTPRARDGAAITPSTYNHRLAVVGAFYTFVLANAGDDEKFGDVLIARNPAHRMRRRKVQAYAAAAPIPRDEMRARLAAIDRSTIIGKRDYALLLVGAMTGRRLAELAAMSLGDLSTRDGALVLTFSHAKGDKLMRDAMASDVRDALLTYLSAVYGGEVIGVDAILADAQANAPVWVSCSLRTRGQRLSRSSIADICAHRLGVSKVHALRHSFAVYMLDAGATLPEIQARLGHDSLETTGHYVTRLTSERNAYAQAIADALVGNTAEGTPPHSA